MKEIIDYINNFNFEKAAQKYSVSTSAIDGGSIGWINSESLSKNILELLKDLNMVNILNLLKKMIHFLFFI